MQPYHYSDINRQPRKLQRHALLTGFAILGVGALIGGNQVMAAVEQNTLKRRGIGLRALDQERASPGFTLFAPHFVENRTVYLVDLEGNVVHTWEMPYPPGMSGYLTERGTLFFQWTNSRTELPQPLSVQGRRGPRGRLERQGTLGGLPSRPPSPWHSAAQRQCAAPLHGPGARRHRPTRERRDGGRQYAVRLICSPTGR